MANYRHSNPLLHYTILAFMVTVGVLTVGTHTVLHAIADPSHSHAAHAEEHCDGSAAHSHTVIFRKDGVTPKQLTVSRCDEIVIKNELARSIVPALGAHTHHLHYDGFEEKPLRAGGTYSLRASEAGTFLIHDHNDEDLNAELIIK